MGMTAVRRSEIAILFVTHRLIDEGLPPAKELRRKVGSLAKEIGISTDEAMQFVQTFLTSYITEAFNADSVSLTIECDTMKWKDVDPD